MRLIDADEAKAKILEIRNAIPRYFPQQPYGFGPQENRDGNLIRGGIKKALRCIEESKTVVVHCKDCVWYYETCRGFHECMNLMRHTNKDWFCGDGVRKESQ